MTTREEWHNAYVEELKDMYNIMMTELLDKFPNTEIDTTITFHDFSRMIFHSSSGRITEYTRALCKENLND
jgi:hypothetical protein